MALFATSIGWFAYDLAADRWRVVNESALRGAALWWRDGWVVAVGGARESVLSAGAVALDPARGREVVLSEHALPSAREDALIAADGDAAYVLFGREGANVARGGARITLTF